MESDVSNSNQAIVVRIPNNSSVMSDVIVKNPSISSASDNKHIKLSPSDRYKFSLFTFYLLGVSILLPWFFFLTANDYWMYKFRMLPENETLFRSIIVGDSDESDLQTVFMAYLSLTATVSSTIVLCIYPFVGNRVPLRLRMYLSLASTFFLFVATTVFVNIDTDHWQEGFFSFTMGIVVLLNIASAILQSSVFGIVGLFPPNYIAACISGLALGGVFAAVAQIVSLWVGASATQSALVYFVIADVFLFITFVAYTIVERTTFFKFHVSQLILVPSGSIQYEQLPSESRSDSVLERRVDYVVILKKISVCAFAVWMCFLVSISLFPAVTVRIMPDSDNHSEWNDKYFQPVVTYFVYSLCDYLGRLLAGYIQYPKESDWKVGVFSLSRIVFIPLLMVCNAHPRAYLPVLIPSEVWYFVITVLFGLSNGYLASIVMIISARIVEPYEQEIAASFMAAFLGAGLAMGSGLGFLWIRLL